MISSKTTQLSSFPTLKPGDFVDIIAPGSSKSKNVLEDVVSLVRSWSLSPVFPNDLFGEELLYAHNNTRRYEIVRDAFYNSKSSVVWALSGGYGSTRLIPDLSKLVPPSQPKLLIGFSDITALHMFVTEKWGWTALHAPVLAQIAQKTVDQESIDHVHRIVFGDCDHVSYASLIPLNNPARSHGLIKANVTGGNISMIQSGIGTLWHLKTKGRILFFEDVDERAYRTAERLEHLRQSGLFEEPAAIIFSNFSWNQTVEEGPELTEKILKRFAEECAFPVFRHSGIGHGSRNLSIPINIEGCLDRKMTGSDLYIKLRC